MDTMTFDEKVTSLCEARGWNQSDLARAVGGVSKNTVSRWWNGAVRPFDDVALRLSRALGVTLDYLADDEMDEFPAASEGLTDDERFVLENYRSLKAAGAINRDTAIAGLGLAVQVKRDIAANGPWPDPDAEKKEPQPKLRLGNPRSHKGEFD